MVNVILDSQFYGLLLIFIVRKNRKRNTKEWTIFQLLWLSYLLQISSPKWTKPRPKPLVVSCFLFFMLSCFLKPMPKSLSFFFVSDSKMDGLDDALVHQTKMHHESFLPISVGTSSAKASADIVTFFALAASTLKYYYHHYWTTKATRSVSVRHSWQQRL